jgi:hypothetical protein
MSRTRVATVAAVVAAEFVLAALLGMGFVEPLLTLAIVVPILVALSRQPQLGLLALVAFLPYDGLLLLVPHPFLVQGWKEALVIATFAATFVAPKSARAAARVGPRRRPQWVLAALGLLATSFVSLVLHPGLAGIYDLKIGFLFGLAALAAWRCPLDERQRDRLVSILMFNAVVTGVYGVAQQFIGYQRLHDLGYEYNTTIRFNGSLLRSFSSFTAPFEFAYFLALAILVCLPVALGDPRRARNRAFLLAMPIIGAGLLVAGIRAAWVGTAVGIAYLGFRRYRSLLFAIPVGLVVLLLVPVAFPNVSTSALSSSSSEERAVNWATNLEQITSHPIGVGVGSASAAAGKVQELQGRSVSFYEPDNEYVFLAYELGVIGLWWYVLMLIYAFKDARIAEAELPGDGASFAAGLSAVVLATAFMSVVAVFFSTYPANQLWWVLFGVMSAVVPAPVRRARGEPAAGGPVLAVSRTSRR